MTRVRALLLLVSLPSCSLFVAPAPPDGGAGEGEGEGAGEGEGEGGEGEGEGELRIVSIDGDGLLLPLPEDVDGVAAAHRISSGITVSFNSSDPVDSATIESPESRVQIQPENTEAGVVFLPLPSLPRRTALTLTLLIGGESASAQVFFLGGEPGPPGPPGPPGLIESRDATAEECPFGGRVFEMGSDLDDDGELDLNEVRSTEPACDAVVTGQQVRSVTDEASLRRELDALGEVRIAASGRVILQLPAGDIPMSTAVGLAHADGQNIVLRGELGTRLLFPATNSGLVVTSAFQIETLEVVGEGAPRLGGGVVAVLGGVAMLRNVTVSGFAEGISARSGGIVLADDSNVVAERNENGFVAGESGIIQARGAVARSNVSFGFLGGSGGILIAIASRGEGNRFGYLAVVGGVVDASAAVSTDIDAGFTADHGGHITCADASSTAVRSLGVFDGSTALCSDATLANTVQVVHTSHANLTRSSGPTDLQVSTNSTAIVVSATTPCSNDATSLCIR